MSTRTPEHMVSPDLAARHARRGSRPIWPVLPAPMAVGSSARRPAPAARDAPGPLRPGAPARAARPAPSQWRLRPAVRIGVARGDSR